MTMMNPAMRVTADEERVVRAWSVLGQVLDPEVPALSVCDLGIVRDVRPQGDGVEVVLTPTYSGCPAMAHMAAELTAVLERAGVEIVTGRRVAAVLSDGERWVTTFHGATREPDEATAVIATPPVPQILELLRDGAVAVPAEYRERLESFTYHRVLALLAVLDRSPGLPAPGATLRLYTELVVREDSWALYGFDRAAERTVFQRLLSASGVGPKLAGAGLDEARVENQVINGGGPMPAGLVSGADLDNVVAYVVSIQ